MSIISELENISFIQLDVYKDLSIFMFNQNDYIINTQQEKEGNQ